MYTSYTSEQIGLAHARWVEGYVNRGWTPYLLSFMFSQINGSPHRIMTIMRGDVERAFGVFLTRVNRKPHSARQQGNLPVWIGCIDYPVAKHARDSKRMVLPNDGCHVHATLLMPPFSRMPDVEAHFLACERIYLQADYPLARLDCRPIVSRPGYVHQYVMKAMLNGRVSEDEWFILPKSLSEL